MTRTKKAHERLRAWRDSAGLSQEKAAVEVGCTLRWYQQIESGRSAPSLSMAVYMKPITGIEPGDWVSSGSADAWVK